MNQPVPITPDRSAAFVAAAGARASYRFFEFFTPFPAFEKGPYVSAYGWHC
jgi:hypothetical protein